MTASRRNSSQPRKTAEQVAARIIRDMTRRQLPPDSRLPTEAAMMEMYGVSRGSLREALRILEVNGLIVVRAGPHGGPHVATVTPTDFSRTMSMFFEVGGSTYAEVLAARVEVEPILARLAAHNINDQGRAELKESLQRHTAFVADVAEDSYIETTQQFHETVARNCGNSVLSLFGQSLKEIYVDRLRISHQPPSRWPEIGEEHQRIAEAIHAGDTSAAEEEMRSHMQKFTNSVRDRYGFLLDEVVGWQL